MTLPFLPYAKQSIVKQDILSVSNALGENLITRGPIVEQFENAIARYCGAPFAVAFSSGTAALMGAYFAANLTLFDHVISTPNTFIASIGVPIQIGIRPTFIDIDSSTGHFDLKDLQNHIAQFQSTRGRPFIIPVHFAGIAIDMKRLQKNCVNHEAVIIEDAAHALGSQYPSGEMVGSCAYSDMTMFSFHPAKTITTGEGGMVTTKDPELYHRLRLFRDNGIEREDPYVIKGAKNGYYEVDAITGNYHLTSFQAALGLSQMKRLKSFITKRRFLVECYRKRLKSFPHLRMLMDEQDELTAFHLLVVQIDFQAYKKSREEVMSRLKEKGIGTQVHYIPLYHHPILKNQPISKLPRMENYYEQTLSLPLFYDLQEEDVDRVCKELKVALS